MKRLIFAITFAAALVSAAFGQNHDKLGTQEWKLIQIDGISIGETSKAFLELDLDKTRFTGSTGCNRMFGAVDVQGRRVDFSNIGTTKMACVDPKARRVETAFVRALENADRYRERANTLELYDRNRLLAKLAVAKHPRQDDDRISLEDRKWILDSIAGIGTSKVGRTAFVVFDPKKQSAGGNSSCNVFGGSYSTKGDTLKITDVVSTMRACVEDERMSIERQFLDGLQKANRYEIKGGKLILFRNGKELLSFMGERKSS
jgi:heat shock protein HslJ